MIEKILKPEKNTLPFDALKPLSFSNSCVTIGNFDGVHLGHQAIIKQMVQEGRKHNHPVIVVTFYPNPLVIIKQIKAPFYLSTPIEKEEFLLDLGVDKVITLRFNQELANLSPEQFLFGLKRNLDLSVLVAGEDFVIGKDRSGTIPVIEKIGRAQSFLVRVVSRIENAGVSVSSTRVRESLDVGNVALARQLLGRPYRLTGIVTHGSDRGDKIGVPTANITHWEKKKLPSVGVYATLVHLNNDIYYGITNVGFRPTFENQSMVNVETWIFNFNGNIYGEIMSLDFIEKLRDEQKFATLDAFLNQIERDKKHAQRIFQNVKTETNLPA